MCVILSNRKRGKNHVKVFIKKWLNLSFYISELDQFLTFLKQQFPKPSAAQQREQEKYQRIFALRDRQHETPSKKKLWDKF